MKGIHPFFRIIMIAVACLLFHFSYGQPVSVNDSLLVRLDKAASDTEKINILIRLSNGLCTSNAKLSLKYGQDAVSLAEQTNDPMLLAYTLNKTGKAIFYTGLVDIAAGYFNRYLEIIKKNGSKKELGTAYYNLGAIRLMLDEYDKAEELCNNAIVLLREYYKEKHDSLPVAFEINFCNNLAIIYREQGNYTRALEYNERGIRLARTESELQPELAMLLQNLGELFVKQNKYDDAEKALNEARELLLKTGNLTSESGVLMSLGTLKVETGDNKKALEYLRNGYFLAEKVGNISMIHSLAEPLYKLYEKTGQPDSALKYMIISNENEKKENLSKANDELTRQELRDEFLKRETLLMKEHEARSKRTDIFIVSIISGLAIAIIFLVYTRKKLKQSRSEKDARDREARQLMELNATKDKLFSIIAHDLRGPVGSMIPALDMLAGNPSLDDKLKQRILDGLKKESKSTFTLLENLLNWARIQGNIIRIAPEKIALKQALQDNVELLIAIAERKSINIWINADEDLSLFADRETFNVVVRNILSNAIKFTAEGGSVTLTARGTDHKGVVIIEDTGTGMDRSTLEVIFSSKTNIPTYGTNREKGTGLGLAICKDFIMKNGGEIFAESEPGKGSRFTFTLPLYEQEI